MISFEHISIPATRALGLMGIPVVDDEIWVDDSLEAIVHGGILVYKYFTILGHFILLEKEGEIDICRDFDEMDRYLFLFKEVNQ